MGGRPLRPEGPGWNTARVGGRAVALEAALVGAWPGLSARGGGDSVSACVSPGLSLLPS